MDDAWWGIIIYTFLSDPSYSLTHVDYNQRRTIWYVEPVGWDACLEKYQTLDANISLANSSADIECFSGQIF